MKYRFVYVIMFMVAAVEGQAAPLALHDAQTIYHPGPSMFILEDREGELTIDEVVQPESAANFVPSWEEHPNFGYTRSTYWLRLNIQNQAVQHDVWLLELLFANLHYVDFYRTAPDGDGYLAIKTGVMRPVTSRDVDHHRFFFRLPLSPGDTQTVYLRVQSGASMTLAMQVMTPDAYVRKVREEYLFLGIFLAALFILSVYSAFLWYSLRDRAFLSYTLSTLSLMLMFLAYDGAGFYYLWAGMPGINRYAIFLGGGIYGIMIVQFMMVFLESAHHYPVAIKLFRFLQIAVFFVMTASVFMEYGQAVRLMNLVAFGGIPIIAFISIRVFVRGFRLSLSYFLILGIGGVWVIILPLVRSGFIASVFLTEHAVEICSLGLSFLWAFALMKRVTFLRQEQEQTSAALEESERQFRDITNNIPGMVYQFRTRQDGSTYFSYASPRAQDIFGLPDDFISRDWELRTRIYPDDLDAFLSSVNYAVQTCSNWNYEGRISLPDGRVKWFHGISSPTRIHDEVVFNGILLDITERKQAEAEIQKLNAELEMRVHQRTAELEIANKDLRSFAYVVSHDLKTPLRGISHLAQWLVKDYAEAFDADGKRMIDLLVGRVQRMDDLIDGILQYSRVGRVVGAEETVDLNTLVRNVIDSLSPPEHIQIVVEEDLPELVGDRTRIVQVFQNLIDNAVKFQENASGSITIRCVDDGLHWIFSVLDNGPGIDDKYHDKIFQIFQTLRSGGDPESLGIGLALVKKIVELYGGSIWVESTPGQGSAFSFTWPKKGITQNSRSSQWGPDVSRECHM